MDLESLQTSLADDEPPAELSLALQALWHEANGNWERAHKVAQSDKTHSGAWGEVD